MLRFFFIFFLVCFTSFSQAESKKTSTITLDDAILLAIRKNPNVQQAELNHVLQKYSYALAAWDFAPHYSFSAKTTTTRNFSVTEDGYVTENSTGVDGAVTWLTPYGTKSTLATSINQTSHFHPAVSLEVMQPLMRGFGRPIVEAALYNAKDSELISLLNIENVLRSTVTSVINSYLDVVAAQKNLRADLDALQRAELSVQQTKFFIKSGRKAGVELVAVEANVAIAQMNIENDKNNLLQARFALLSAIGIDPNSPLEFAEIDVQALIKKYVIPSLPDAKKLAIENDLQYQTDQMTYDGAKKRTLLTAEDNTRFELNLNGSLSTGSTGGDSENSGLKSLVNGINQTSLISLNLVVPIDDRAAKIAVQNAKIALQEARLAMQQEKWNKETNAINQWNNIFSAKRSLHYAENAEHLQRKTYEISDQKYSHGLIDSLQLQSSQQQLMASEQALNMAQINYLKALVNFDLLVGQTLKTWKVKTKNC